MGSHVGECVVCGQARTGGLRRVCGTTEAHPSPPIVGTRSSSSSTY